MRCIGSQALKEICLLDMKVLSTDVIGKLVSSNMVLLEVLTVVNRNRA